MCKDNILPYLEGQKEYMGFYKTERSGFSYMLCYVHGFDRKADTHPT